MNGNEKYGKRDATPIERAASAATRSVGSVPSILIHSILFVGIFGLEFFGLDFDQIMLILTTAVSLEAIYLAIFIQMSVNRQEERITEVSEDVEEIFEDVEEISKDVDAIQEDVEDLGDEIEEDDLEDSAERREDLKRIANIETAIRELLNEVREIRSERK